MHPLSRVSQSVLRLRSMQWGAFHTRVCGNSEGSTSEDCFTSSDQGLRHKVKGVAPTRMFQLFTSGAEAYERRIAPCILLGLAACAALGAQALVVNSESQAR